MKYSIIIPTYNHCDDLLKPCIDSILKYSIMSEVELIISANGCVDNTKSYLEDLKRTFKSIDLENNLKIVWDDQALGYPKATNAGIRVATTDNIVLLNNDTILLPQNPGDWLKILEHRFTQDSKCGISGVHALRSNITNREFIVFFCVMIKREVFDKIGLLNEMYGIGAGEDTEFCYEAERVGFTIAFPADNILGPKFYTGSYPIYHVGEGTMHDPTLVKDWDKTFFENGAMLAKKYNPELYQNSYANKNTSDIPVRLNLGCGLDYQEGFINVDLYPQENAVVDAVFDAKQIPYSDNSVDEIKAFHVIEHFKWSEAISALQEWFRVLKPGGRLWLETPDMLESFREYINADQNYRYVLNGHLFSEGGDSPGQTHYFLLTEFDLINLLRNIGFSQVNRISPSSGYTAHLPPHIFLCVEAFK
jgi:glycosyltransferase involved in cell wall biosynthesis